MRQAAVMIPFALVSPAYFANKIQLGALTQTAEAFGQVQDALSFFVTAYRTMAEWRAVVARLDGFEGGIASADRPADRIRFDRHDADRNERDQPATASGEPAEWQAAGLRRRLQPSRRRAHAPDRTVGVRQIDAVPRHRRHLAVRRGRDRYPCECIPDDAAATAVFPDRIAARGDRLSRRDRKLRPRAR